MSSTRTRLAAVATGVLLSAAAAPAAHAAVVPLGSGATVLRFDARVAKALGSLDVDVSGVRPAEQVNRSAAFPITGGSIDPATGGGTIRHAGGLRLRTPDATVTLTKLVVTVGTTPTVSAVVNGGKRLTAFKLDLSKTTIKRVGPGTAIKKVGLLLSPQGARALNQAFGVTAFKGNGRLGAVAVVAVPSRAELAGGNTVLALDPGAASALGSLGIEPGLADGAFVRADGSYAFPITGGALDADTLAGSVQHSGTLTLTRGSTQVRLSDLTVDTTAETLSASVNGSAPTPILDLDLRKPVLEVRPQKLFVSQIAATLTPGAADALNQAFGTSAFTAGLELGTASVLGQTV